jgi:membrane-bound serine protease (ClpP class)
MVGPGMRVLKTRDAITHGMPPDGMNRPDARSPQASGHFPTGRVHGHAPLRSAFRLRGGLLLRVAILLAFGLWAQVLPALAAAQDAEAAQPDAAAGAENAGQQAEDQQAEDPPAKPKPKPAENPQAGNQAQALGSLVKVTAPINQQVEQIVRQSVDRLIERGRKSGRRGVLILELQPGRSDYGKALDLARFLSTGKALDVHKVAFVPESLNGHALLVAIACDEIMIHPDATIGQAGIHEELIGAEIRNGYTAIANNSRTIPVDLAIGLVDPTPKVLEIETEVSREIVLESRLDEVRQQRTIVKSTVLIEAGQYGQFTATAARRIGMVSRLVSDRQSLARALGLPGSAVEDDPSLGGSWRPVRVEVKGPITTRKVEQLKRLIADQIDSEGANFICLWIDSTGGSPVDSNNLAVFLAGLNPASQRTVAYIPSEARGDAALVAVACDHIVMHPDAVLGGPGAVPIEADEAKLYSESLVDIARQKLHPPALAAALVNPAMEVFRFQRKTDGSEQFFTLQEKDALPDAEEWTQASDEPITTKGEPLMLSGDQARKFEMAYAVVNDFGELRHLYGLEHDPALVEPNWANVLIQAMASPAVAWFLLLIGAGAIYAELQAPGIGIGAFLGTVCFICFFWSNFLGGTAGWFEVLLFLSGVVFVALEIFVLPGFGIFGLGGGALIITSLVLASQTFVLPRNEYQLHELEVNLLMVLTGTVFGVMFTGMVVRRFLPHTPGLRQVVLLPPSSEEQEQQVVSESFGAYGHLLGTSGQTMTPLTPAGKVRFGNEYVDVVSDGEMIPAKTTVRVVEVHGHRVVVTSNA